MSVAIPTVWWHDDDARLALLNSVSRQLAQYEIADPGSLPNLRNDPALFVATDFGGAHREATYETTGVLLAGSESVWSWLPLQKALRVEHMSDGRRMSYKGLNDRQKQRALPAFLSSANLLNGLLLLVIVDKRLGSMFSNSGRLSRESLDYPRLDLWPLQRIERVLRATSLVSLLMRGLSRQGQDLTWFLDEDEVVANETRLREFIDVFGSVSSHYIPHLLGHCRIGTTACDNGSREIEDLAALPDLAIGALADVLPELVRGDGLGTSLTTMLPEGLKPKTRTVMSWIATRGAPLRRCVLVLSPSPTSAKCQVSLLRFDGVGRFS